MADTLSEFLTVKNLLFPALGFLMSYVLENFTWFTALPKDRKRHLLMGVAAVLGVAIYLLNTYLPPEIITALEPFYAVIVMSMGMVGSAEITHKFANQKPGVLTELGEIKSNMDEHKKAGTFD